MRLRVTTFLVVGAIGLAACGGDEPPAPAVMPPPTAAAAAAPDVAGGGPAGEVAADSREPSEPATTSAGTPLLGPDASWQPFLDTGIPFVFGADAGLAAARKAGRPAMLFYAATW